MPSCVRRRSVISRHAKISLQSTTGSFYTMVTVTVWGNSCASFNGVQVLRYSCMVSTHVSICHAVPRSDINPYNQLHGPQQMHNEMHPCNMLCSTAQAFVVLLAGVMTWWSTQAGCLDYHQYTNDKHSQGLACPSMLAAIALLMCQCPATFICSLQVR